MCRPQKEIDWDKVDYMLQCGAIGTEIAATFFVHPDTLYDRIQAKYGMTFSAFKEQRCSQGDYFIRQKQYEKALEGDNTLLIWLGKNRLGQKNEDKIMISEDGLKALEKSMEILNHLQSKSDSKLEIEIQSENA